MKSIAKFVLCLTLSEVAYAQQAPQQYFVAAPQSPQAPAMRHVMTPDGRAVQLGQPVPQQRQPAQYETTRFPTRMIYLNGQNINSTKNQTLENVTVRIDEQGNVHLTAPHYEIATDSSYHPLLPSELPRFPKVQVRIDGLPQGTFSKDDLSAKIEARLPTPPSQLGSNRPSPEDNPPPIAPPSDPSIKAQVQPTTEKQTAKPDVPSTPGQ